jgi:hypothetical protein
VARRQRKPRLVSKVTFSNGALFEAWLHPVAPPAADPSDVIEVRITAEEGYGGDGLPEGWFMNAYDLQCLQWLLANAILNICQRGEPMMPVNGRERPPTEVT